MSSDKRSFYGWGKQGEAIPADELHWFESAWAKLFGVDQFVPAAMPDEAEISLRAPRVQIPASLSKFCTVEKYDRLLHAYGRSVHDLARMIHQRDFSHPPDFVAYPRAEADVAAVLDWCGANRVAAIPFGGGTSVVGGVNPPADDRYKGCVSLDLKHSTGCWRSTSHRKPRESSAAFSGPNWRSSSSQAD